MEQVHTGYVERLGKRSNERRTEMITCSMAMSLVIFLATSNRMQKCNSIPTARHCRDFFRFGEVAKCGSYTFHTILFQLDILYMQAVYSVRSEVKTQTQYSHIHTATGTNTFTCTANNISRHCWKIKMYGTWFFNEKKKEKNLSKLPKWKSTETIRTIHSTHFHTYRRETTHWNISFHFVFLFFFFSFFLFSFCRFNSVVSTILRESASIERTEEKFTIIFFLVPKWGTKKKLLKILSPFSVRVYGVPVCECVLSKKRKWVRRYMQQTNTG